MGKPYRYNACLSAAGIPCTVQCHRAKAHEGLVSLHGTHEGGKPSIQPLLSASTVLDLLLRQASLRASVHGASPRRGKHLRGSEGLVSLTSVLEVFTALYYKLRKERTLVSDFILSCPSNSSRRTTHRLSLLRCGGALFFCALSNFPLVKFHD